MGGLLVWVLLEVHKGIIACVSNTFLTSLLCVYAAFKSSCIQGKMYNSIIDCMIFYNSQIKGLMWTDMKI